MINATDQYLVFHVSDIIRNVINLESREMQTTLRRKSFKAETLPHLEILWQTSLWLTRDGHEADNLVQDTYAEACRLWDQSIPDINCKAWLFMVLIKLYLNNFQQESRPHVPIITNNVEESFFYSNSINATFANLPEDIRLVMLLSILGEFTYQEIAEICRLKLEIVKSRLYQGRKSIKKESYKSTPDACLVSL